MIILLIVALWVYLSFIKDIFYEGRSIHKLSDIPQLLAPKNYHTPLLAAAVSFLVSLAAATVGWFLLYCIINCGFVPLEPTSLRTEVKVKELQYSTHSSGTRTIVVSEDSVTPVPEIVPPQTTEVRIYKQRIKDPFLRTLFLLIPIQEKFEYYYKGELINGTTK